MDQKAIFQSLSELENSLSNITSAAEMVKSTTESYDALQEQAKRYCEELSSITTQLKRLSEQMDGGYASILADTNSRGNAILSEMSSQSEKLIRQAEANYSSFFQKAEAQFLDAASGMDAKAQEILKDVKAGQDALAVSTGDKLSGSITAFDRDAHSILTSMEEQFSSQLMNSAQSIDARAETLKKSLCDLADTTNSLNSAVQTMRQYFSDEHRLLDDKLRRFHEAGAEMKKNSELLQPQFTALRKEFEKQQATLEKMAAKCGRINLWLIVLAIAVIGCSFVLLLR